LNYLTFSELRAKLIHFFHICNLEEDMLASILFRKEEEGYGLH